MRSVLSFPVDIKFNLGDTPRIMHRPLQYVRNIVWSAVVKIKAKPSMAKPRRRFEVNGFVTPGFEKVADTFRSNLDSGIEKGGNFAAYYKGKLVVNLWAGYSDNDCRRLWKEDTLSTFFSSTKAVAAFVIAHLVDRGLLDYKEKVCKYWPAFAQNGKEDVTLEQLISNQAGLITLDKKYWLAEMRDDPEGLSRKLAEQKPYWKPGTKHGYHPLTFGLYLDQVVRHADPKRRSLSQYFKEEIAEPFNIELYVGLPKELYHRSTRVYFQGDSDTMNAEFLKAFRGDINFLMKTTNNPQDFKITIKMNDPDIRELPVPSTHGHGNAANMAKLFGIIANGGVLDGKQLLSQKVIQKFTQPVVHGIDVSFGMDAAWSLGTHLITTVTGNEQANQIFGHGGYGGQFAASDIKHKIGFAYTTNFLDPFSSYNAEGDPRLFSLFKSLYQCVYEIEGIKTPMLTFKLYSQYKKYADQMGMQSKL